MANVLVLIDSNIYLDLYTSKDLRELLTTLPTIPGLFVSAQIVEEVARRRLAITSDAFKPALEATKTALPIPQAALEEFPEDVTQEIKRFTDSAQALRSKLTSTVKELLRRIADGSDPVSTALATVFKNAVRPSDEELSRARARRERGTPPGKSSDTLGDQLTWEQFLSRCAGAAHVFIVSRDGDYIEKWNGELFLNPVLRGDLRKIAPKATVSVFTNFAEAIPELKKVSAKVAVPTPEKLEKAKTAEDQVAARDRVARALQLPTIDTSVYLRALQLPTIDTSAFARALQLPTIDTSAFLRALQLPTIDTSALTRALQMQNLHGPVTAEKREGAVPADKNKQKIDKPK